MQVPESAAQKKVAPWFSTRFLRVSLYACFFPLPHRPSPARACAATCGGCSAPGAVGGAITRVWFVDTLHLMKHCKECSSLPRVPSHAGPPL